MLAGKAILPLGETTSFDFSSYGKHLSLEEPRISVLPGFGPGQG
jgi:hypothetical protein